jgi:hypothetical protein
MPRHAGKKDLFDRVIAAVDFAVDHRVERLFRGHRPQAGRDEDPLANGLRLFFPFGLRLGRRPGMVSVGRRPLLAETRIVELFARQQDARDIRGIGSRRVPGLHNEPGTEEKSQTGR